MIQVYHNAEFLDFHHTKTVDPESLVWVADIDTDDLEGAYAASQNIAADWQFGPLVLRHADRPMRSTSIGDVLVHNGHAWIVGIRGFTQAQLGGKL